MFRYSCDSAVSLFAGCGGSDLGLRQAGIETIWANEKSESACKLYEQVVGKGIVVHDDIARVRSFPKSDVLVGCYPCQGYSQGGRRNDSDKINYLYREFDRALRSIRPLAFIVENVDGMRFAQNRHLLANQLTRFRMAGYRVAHKILDARSFGLAQERKRLFLVGIRSSEGMRYEFPRAAYGPGEDLLPYRSLRDVIWKYKDAPTGSYCDEPFHWYYLSRNRRRGWDDQAPCVVAHWRHVALHPDSPPLVKVGADRWTFSENLAARRLSYLECAALQGFPDPHAFNTESVRLRFRAIGNAVPPPLFAAVARALVTQLQGDRSKLGTTILMRSS
ncbi:DNA cytosine methyltransferase [Paludisphaera borealis]|uniref:DNA cytosine methyltransferase n=1 Tax=Paludisphaera borealis TaxID=1387353 RepID=UPI0035A3B5B8